MTDVRGINPAEAYNSRGPIHPAVLYDYLLEARARIFDRVRSLRPDQYAQEFPFARKSIRSTLVHVADTEWWYTLLIRGEPEPEMGPFAHFAQTDFPPLEGAWTEQFEWTRQTLREVSDWQRRVEARYPRPDGTVRGLRTTVAGVAAQLLFHDVHHRAQVMAMMRHLDAPVQSIDYSLEKWEWFTERTGS